VTASIINSDKLSRCYDHLYLGRWASPFGTQVMFKSNLVGSDFTTEVKPI